MVRRCPGLVTDRTDRIDVASASQIVIGRLLHFAPCPVLIVPVKGLTRPPASTVEPVHGAGHPTRRGGS